MTMQPQAGGDRPSVSAAWLVRTHARVQDAHAQRSEWGSDLLYKVPVFVANLLVHREDFVIGAAAPYNIPELLC